LNHSKFNYNPELAFCQRGVIFMLYYIHAGRNITHKQELEIWPAS
jgi:hypothetical protein